MNYTIRILQTKRAGLNQPSISVSDSSFTYSDLIYGLRDVIENIIIKGMQNNHTTKSDYLNFENVWEFWYKDMNTFATWQVIYLPPGIPSLQHFWKLEITPDIPKFDKTLFDEIIKDDSGITEGQILTKEILKQAFEKMGWLSYWDDSLSLDELNQIYSDLSTQKTLYDRQHNINWGYQTQNGVTTIANGNTPSQNNLDNFFKSNKIYFIVGGVILAIILFKNSLLKLFKK